MKLITFDELRNKLGGRARSSIYLDLEQLKNIVDPAKFIGRSDEQVDQFLQESVQPHLDRLEKIARKRLSNPSIRV